MIPPLLSSAANALLEAKIRTLFQLDPFWREHLAKLDGLRLKLVLTDSGFKRVIQFGPSNIHLAAPFTQADVTLTTQTLHLAKLLNATATEQAIADGHFYVQGDEAALTAIATCLRQLDLDWEAKLAEILPDFAANQLHSVAQLASRAFKQAVSGASDSYHFWRSNEHHGQQA